METFIKIAIGIILVIIIALMINEGITRQEKVECLKWEKWSQEYSNFYYTDWQKIQCNIQD